MLSLRFQSGYMNSILMAYVQAHNNANAQLSNGLRAVKFGQSLHLPPYSMFVRGKVLARLNMYRLI